VISKLYESLRVYFKQNSLLDLTQLSSLDRPTCTLEGCGFFSGGPFFTPTISEINLLVPLGNDNTERSEFVEKRE